MTLMKIFGKSTETLSVTCDAEMRLPNTDVMFVLDNTGSMGDTPSGDSQTKMASLQVSVKCFYEIVARLDTDATCTPATPSGGTSTRPRSASASYPMIRTSMSASCCRVTGSPDSWTYQSREQSLMYGVFDEWNDTRDDDNNIVPDTQNAGNWSGWTNYGSSITTTSNGCNNNQSPHSCRFICHCRRHRDQPGPTNVARRRDSTLMQTTTQSEAISAPITRRPIPAGCKSGRDRSNASRTYDKMIAGNPVTASTPNAVSVPAWKYKAKDVNISGLKNGRRLEHHRHHAADRRQFLQQAVTWDGCIEERRTVRQESYEPIPTDAEDLDIDTAPTSGDAASLWGLALDDVVYPRRSDYRNSSNYSMNEITTFTNYTGKSYSCLQELRRLQTWGNSATAFDAYVDSMHPASNTYHDIGLLWGARLMSPTGLFKADNALTPTGGQIQRHMIFMTDGDPCTSVNNYQAYGLGWFDRRQTDPSVAPTDGCTTTGTLTQQVNARTVALCQAIQNKRITLWVITFGSVDPNTVTRLTACASAGHYFGATNAEQLQSTFATIANQITQLRLTK